MGEGAGPEVWTRRSAAAAVGVAPTTLREWERAGWVDPAVRRAAAGQTRANLYRAADVACAALVRDLRAAGVSGDLLAAATATVKDIGPRPGWEGWVLVEPATGRTALASSAEQAVGWAAGSATVALLARVVVPAQVGQVL